MCLYVMHCILVIRINSNSVEVAVNRNISYETGPSRSTSGLQAILKLLDQVLQLNTAESVHHMKP